MAEFLVNGKNAVTVGALNKFKSHSIRPVLAVFDTTGRTESALAAERNKFQISAFGTGIHCPAERWVTTVANVNIKM